MIHLTAPEVERLAEYMRDRPHFANDTRNHIDVYYSVQQGQNVVTVYNEMGDPIVTKLLAHL